MTNFQKEKVNGIDCWECECGFTAWNKGQKNKHECDNEDV